MTDTEASSLKGEAAEVLHSLEISSNNYQEAWELLFERYDNKRLIIQIHINAICDLPSAPKESLGILRQILDNSLKHIRALKALKRPVEHWDDMLIHLITKKLDSTTTKEWEQTLKRSDIPTFKDVRDFLMHKCQALEATSRARSEASNQAKMYNNKPKGTIAHVATQETSCPVCNKTNHLIYQCKNFLNLSIKQRLQEAKSKNLCINCLKTNHRLNKCKSSTCRKCNKVHNTLLHFEDISQPSTSNNSQLSNTVVAHSCKSNETSQIFLSTAIINIRDGHRRIQQCRALLDSGSQSNFITKTLAEKLALKQSHVRISVVGINNVQSRINHSVKVHVASKYNSFQTKLDCLIIENISQNLPQFSVKKTFINIPNDIKLADPEFHISREIDMLIGAELFWQLLCIGQIRSSSRQPYLQKTHFGWIVSGKIYTDSSNKFLNTRICNLSMMNLERQLTKFWHVEKGLISNTLTIEEQQCEEIFRNTYKRNSQGRFIVQLPLKENVNKLGDSKCSALKRFFSLERKLNKQIELKEQYHKFMSEYLELGHMKLISRSEITNNETRFYLPHHAVIKDTSTTTRLRVVFDGSAKTSSGLSVNDTMLVGPTTQDDLFSIIIRFRNYRYVMTADISKMYRQILVHESQTRLQRILWRFNSNEPIQTYELQTVTYGAAAASYLAIKSLQQLASNERERFPTGLLPA